MKDIDFGKSVERRKDLTFIFMKINLVLQIILMICIICTSKRCSTKDNPKNNTNKSHYHSNEGKIVNTSILYCLKTLHCQAYHKNSVIAPGFTINFRINGDILFLFKFPHKMMEHFRPFLSTVMCSNRVNMSIVFLQQRKQVIRRFDPDWKSGRGFHIAYVLKV